MINRKHFGPQSIDKKIADLLQPMFRGSKKEFILINNLVKNWEEIVGKKYAVFCYPKTVNFGKEKNNAKLTIAAYNAAVGFFLEQNSELILERMASFYGFKSVTKIIIKQEPKNIEMNHQEEVKLPAKQQEFLDDKTAEIIDRDLAETLQKLGKRILQEKGTLAS